MPEAEIAVLSPAEIAFRCHGLEFARARLAHEPGVFPQHTEIVFGVGAQETVLCDSQPCPHSPNWCAASAKCVIPRAHAITRSGDCIRNAGWNRWWCRTSPPWTNASIPLFLFSGARIFRCRSRHDRRAERHPRRTPHRASNSRPMKTFTCPCRVSITGRAWPGTTLAESSSASDIFLEESCAPTSRYFFSWRQPCTSIPQRIPCCITSRQRLIGCYWALTSTGARESVWCLESGRFEMPQSQRPASRSTSSV